MYRPYDNYDSETAIAYAWLVLTIFIIVAGILTVFFWDVINSIIDGPNHDQSIGINHDIKAGRLSQQGANAAQFNISFATNIPIMIILTIIGFAVARAIVVKRVP